MPSNCPLKTECQDITVTENRWQRNLHYCTASALATSQKQVNLAAGGMAAQLSDINSPTQLVQCPLLVYMINNLKQKKKQKTHTEIDAWEIPHWLLLAQGLAALGATVLTHLALVHVSWTLVVIREGDEVGHHTQNAVREELQVSGHSRNHLRLHGGHIHEDLHESNQTGQEESKTNLPVITFHFSFSCVFLSAA